MNAKYERKQPMKRGVALCGVAMLVLFASSARAAPIDFSIVAVADTLVGGFDDVGNSAHDEQDFLFDYLVGQGFNESDLTYQKIDLGGSSSFLEVINDPAGTDLWAIDFAAFGLINPLVFLVKFGNAQFEHYLYENLPSFQYGVVDLEGIVAANGNITISSISHTSAAVGPTVTVPEPGSLLLMGCGLIFLSRRLRRKVAH